MSVERLGAGVTTQCRGRTMDMRLDRADEVAAKAGLPWQQDAGWREDDVAVVKGLKEASYNPEGH